MSIYSMRNETRERENTDTTRTSIADSHRSPITPPNTCNNSLSSSSTTHYHYHYRHLSSPATNLLKQCYQLLVPLNLKLLQKQPFLFKHSIIQSYNPLTCIYIHTHPPTHTNKYTHTHAYIPLSY